MAFYCSHIAAHLVEEDAQLMIYGPVIMNAEVLVSKSEPDQIRHAGIGQQRGHLESLLYNTYPLIDTVSQISPHALAYSLANGQIDGAVMDVTKASLLPGFQFHPVAKDDYVSHVLVIRKNLESTAEFEKFLEDYQKAVDNLQDVKSLSKELGISSQIKFLYLE